MKRRHVLSAAGAGLATAGDRKDPYDVFLIDKRGRETVFAHYRKC